MAMHTNTKKIIIVLLLVAAILAAAVGRFIRRTHADHRSIPGHIVRWFRGEGGLTQTMNDLADDIRVKPELAQLQPWGVETLRRFQEGKVQTNGRPLFYWDESPAVKLARQEKPEFIKHQWGEINEDGEEEPEIFIVYNTNKQPEAVVIGWYMYGIQIGPPEYRLSYTSCWYAPYVQAKPGVYVYGNSK